MFPFLLYICGKFQTQCCSQHLKYSTQKYHISESIRFPPFQ